MRFVLVFASLGMLSGCAWNSAATIRALGPVGGEQQVVGQVVDSAWSHYGSCQEAAEMAYDGAYRQAQQLGGDGLINVWWIINGKEYAMPVCQTRFMIYWWGSKAMMTATAVKRGR